MNCFVSRVESDFCFSPRHCCPCLGPREPVSEEYTGSKFLNHYVITRLLLLSGIIEFDQRQKLADVIQVKA